MNRNIWTSRSGRWRAFLAAHRPFLCLLIGVACFRWLSILVLRPGGFIADQSPDSYFYLGLGRLAGSGRVALFDFWMEYPPLMPWLAALSYRLSLAVPPIGSELWAFNTIFRSFLLLFDLGSLTLIYAAARRLGYSERAVEIAGAWAVLFAPLFALLGWFDTLPVFFLLLALYGLLSDRPALAGFAMGAGFMAKVFPVILWPIGWFIWRSRRPRTLYLAASAVAALAIILVPLIASPTYTLATFRTFLARSSWETVWSLLEGYQGYGVVAPLVERVDPARAGFANHPSRLPWLPINGFFAAVYLILITRRIAWQEKPRVAQFALFSLVWFLLYNKGYSPQWTAYFGPLLLLALPGGRGFGYALLLDLLMVLEWPAAFLIFPETPRFLAGVIVLRTLIWIAIGLDCVARFLPPARIWLGVQRWTMPAAVGISLLAGGLAARPVAQAYAAERLNREPLKPWLQELATGALPADPVLVFQSSVLERVAPYRPAGGAALFPLVDGVPWEPVEVWLERAFSRSDRAWVVSDPREFGPPEISGRVQGWLRERACPLQERIYGSVWTGHYLWMPGTEQSWDVPFEQGVALVRATMPEQAVAPGRSVCFRLTWQAAGAVPDDYAVLLHLIGADGALAAQGDAWPALPSREWTPEQPVVSVHTLTLPADLPPGRYRLRTGLYRIADGTRVPLQSGEAAFDFAELVVAVPDF